MRAAKKDPMATIARFLRHVNKTESCWEWTGTLFSPKNYGAFHLPVPGRRKWRAALAHRVSYELFHGPIPENFTIDHLCRNHRCVNPDHLEAVTNKENILRGEGLTAKHARKSACPFGHEYTPRKSGGRKCLTCERQQRKERYATSGA